MLSYYNIVASAVKTKLTHDAKLIGHSHGLASSAARAPLPHHVVEFDLAVAPTLNNKAQKGVEDMFAALVGDAHRALEAKELLCVSGQIFDGYGPHAGTGSEMLRSVSGAILT